MTIANRVTKDPVFHVVSPETGQDASSRFHDDPGFQIVSDAEEPAEKSVLSSLGPLTAKQRQDMQALINEGIDAATARAIVQGYAQAQKGTLVASDVHVPVPGRRKVRKADFDESKHPRGADGKFGAGPSGAKTSSGKRVHASWSGNRADYAGFTAKDHEEAARIHKEHQTSLEQAHHAAVAAGDTVQAAKARTAVARSQLRQAQHTQKATELGVSGLPVQTGSNVPRTLPSAPSAPLSPPVASAEPKDDETSLRTDKGFRSVYTKTRFGAPGATSKRNQRQLHDATTKMTQVLGVPEKFASLNGRLAVRFVDTSSGKNTAAFYDRGNKTIEISQLGRYSLAHEYGHALDHFLAEQAGRQNLLSRLHRDVDVHQGGEMVKAFRDLTSSPEYAAHVSKTASDAAKHAVSHENESYFNNPAEVFARAFHAHVEHKMDQAGHFSPLLNGRVIGSRYHPSHEDIGELSARFDTFMQHLAHSEHINKALDGLIAQEAMRIAKADWDESKHPRGAGGRFGSGGSAPAGAKSTAAAKPRRTRRPAIPWADPKDVIEIKPRATRTKPSSGKAPPSARRARDAAIGRQERREESSAVVNAPRTAEGRKLYRDVKRDHSTHIRALNDKAKALEAKGKNKAAHKIRQDAADLSMYFHNEVNNTRMLPEFAQRVASYRSKYLSKPVKKTDASVLARTQEDELQAAVQAYDPDASKVPPEAAQLMQANRLVAGMDVELASGAADAEQARTRAARALTERPGLYDGVGTTPRTDKLDGLQLDLGAGTARAPGHIGLDLSTFGDHGNAIHDLNLGLKEFPDGSVKAVRLVNSLHAIVDSGDGDPIPLLLEIQRVLCEGGQLTYVGPEALYEDEASWPCPALLLVGEQGVPASSGEEGVGAVRQVFERVPPRVPAFHGADPDYQPAGPMPIDEAMQQADSNSAPARMAMANLVHKTANRVVKIAKAEPHKQVLIGVVLAPHEPDLQGDIMHPDDIEAAAHGYLGTSRVIGSEHGAPIEAHPVESYIAPQDLTFDGPQGRTHVAKGSWVLGVKVVSPDEWAKVMKDGYTGFSVGGFGVREDL